MDTVEFSPLTEKAIADLLTNRGTRNQLSAELGNRRTPRWPFPGTVQLWLIAEDGHEALDFATSVNLGLDGVGVLMDHDLPADTQLAIAIHEPEVSFQGRAVVRHCTQKENGYYLGLQFIFEE